uniref:Very-long-chain (3R)-3-hydroxyacyl-CoA dehydratase n=1 Tax=Salix viminalis TaxID=40686 RepID=A0A6N2LD53_SALVM
MKRNTHRSQVKESRNRDGFGLAVSIDKFQVLFLAVKTLKDSGHEHVYNAVEKPLQLAQTAAVLEIQSHFLVTSLSIRYSFFGMKEVLGFAPSWLMWLRYSTFLLLYPTGISSEVGLIYFALPYIKESDKYCIRMPNKWNFSFDNFYAAILALGIYIPGKNLVDLTQLSSHHFDN